MEKTPEKHTFKGKAACIAVGSELLGDAKLDLNSLEITRVLETYGFDVVEKRVIGDSIERIAASVRELLEGYEVVIVTGGLGPTADDVTREGVALALGRKLLFDAEVEGWLKERYERVGRTMPEIGRSMAMVVEGSEIIRNNAGSAPGILVQEDGRLLAVFPGVPWEMRSMIESHLKLKLEERCEGRIRRSRTLLMGGVVESEVEGRIRHLYGGFGRDNVTILASFGVLRLALTATGKETEVEAELDRMERAFREILGEDVAGVDIASLAKVIVPALISRDQTLATAESCTGGLVGGALTSVSGSSEVYMGGVVSYSNEVKEQMVGVPHDLLIEYGAVSEQVARAMAEGVRQRFSTDWGLGVTGIAGPSGGTDEKPVGLVHWAVAGPEGVVARHHIFPGDRDIVREWSVNVVLDLLRRQLIVGAK
ncbi:MAG: competence/damage-inducible protein A [Acidobacteria bacterium]|nr:MAG: competence/damage-inducible protein A [Acidobacteriota bacterium]